METNLESKALSVIESVLFSSDKPVSLELLNQAIEQVDSNLKTKELIKKYESILQAEDRGVYLDKVSGKYQIRTKKNNSDILKNINKPKQFRLSAPAMEVLAVIAYEQPCIKGRIDEVRSVDSGHLLRVLMDKGFVSFAGKSDLPSKPMLYKTTQKFLETFSLKDLKNLPSLSEVDELIPDVIQEPTSENLSAFATSENQSDHSEQSLNKDLEKIGEALKKIEVTKIN